MSAKQSDKPDHRKSSEQRHKPGERPEDVVAHRERMFHVWHLTRQQYLAVKQMRERRVLFL